MQSDFIPLSNTVTALNKVSRTLQNHRRHQHPKPAYDPGLNTPASTIEELQQQPRGINLPASTTEALQLLASPTLDFAGPVFPFLEDFRTNPGEVQPHDFIRALESDFIGRNWHETWWDMNGNVDVELGNLAGSSFAKYVLGLGLFHSRN
jgi:hypothetical protein